MARLKLNLNSPTHLASLLILVVGLVIAIAAFSNFKKTSGLQAASLPVSLSFNSTRIDPLPGDTVSVDVSVTNPGSVAISGAALEFSFDPRFVTLASFTPRSPLNKVLKAFSASNGRATIVLGSLCQTSGCSTLNQNGVIGTLKLTTASQVGTSTINMVPTTVTSDLHTLITAKEEAGVNLVGSYGSVTVNTVPTTASPTPPSTSCVSSTSGWANLPLGLQTSKFSVEFDATPLSNLMDGVIGLSDPNADSYSDLAAAVRFYTNGRIEARDAGTYRAESSVTYTANSLYHFKMEIDPTSHTYSADVNKSGSPAVRIANNYRFRTEQSTLSQLRQAGYTSGTGRMTLCNLSVSSPSTNPDPIGFKSLDINTTTQGSTTNSMDSITLSGSGSDIWGGKDAFRYAYKSGSGNLTLVTKISAWQPTETWSKAGLMIRSNTEPNSPYTSIFISGGKGIVQQRRSSTGGTSYSTSGLFAVSFKTPVWLKLVKNSNQVTTFYSQDGTNWRQLGNAISGSVSDSFTYGYAVTSHNAGAISTATFSVARP